MANEKIIPLAKGILKHFPFIKNLLAKKTGGTIESRYCYSVWMRHLINLGTADNDIPKVVAELGPGDSLGIGLAALLSGCKKLYAFDVIKYWDSERNLIIFDELVELFKQRAAIPDQTEYALVKPDLENYNFPSDLLSEAWLQEALSTNRLSQIRKEIADAENPENNFIQVQIPWNDSAILKNNSVDFIYSQAVLQHIEDLEGTYTAMKKWLKPLGIMSHTIDFKSMGTTQTWNGHWTYNDLEWKIVRGGKSFLINRHPCSYHLNLHQDNGFQIMKTQDDRSANTLMPYKLAKRFRHLKDNDLTTSGIYVLSQKV